jgi:hypothetical protein
VDIQTPASAPDNFIGFSDPPWRRDENEAPTEDELRNMTGEFLKSLASGWKRGTASIRGMSATSTVPQLCEMLESTLDRPVIDETNLDGTTISTSVRKRKAANGFFTRCAIAWGSRPRSHGATSQCSSCATPSRYAEASAVLQTARDS